MLAAVSATCQPVGSGFSASHDRSTAIVNAGAGGGGGGGGGGSRTAFAVVGVLRSTLPNGEEQPEAEATEARRSARRDRAARLVADAGGADM